MLLPPVGSERLDSFEVAVPPCLPLSGEEVLGLCHARQFDSGSKLTTMFLVLFVLLEI